MLDEKIGIALAAFNPPLISFEKQLKSIQNQSFTNWICIISVDADEACVLSQAPIVDLLEDPRFKVKSNPARLGHKKNFEFALKELLKEQLTAVCFSDQDDFWYPEKLAECLAAFKTLPSMSLVHSDMDLVYGDSETPAGISGWKFERRGTKLVSAMDLTVRNVVAGCSLMMDPELAKRYPAIPESFEYHDHWYAALAACYGVVAPLNKKLYAYRQHGSNVAGITQYDGIFSTKNLKSFAHAADLSMWRYNATVARVEALQSIGYRFPKFLEIGLLRKWDLGLILIGLGIHAFFRGDRMLARAYLVRSIGKTLVSLRDA